MCLNWVDCGAAPRRLETFTFLLVWFYPKWITLKSLNHKSQLPTEHLAFDKIYAQLHNFLTHTLFHVCRKLNFAVDTKIYFLRFKGKLFIYINRKSFAEQGEYILINLLELLFHEWGKLHDNITTTIWHQFPPSIEEFFCLLSRFVRNKHLTLLFQNLLTEKLRQYLTVYDQQQQLTVRKNVETPSIMTAAQLIFTIEARYNQFCHMVKRVNG